MSGKDNVDQELQPALEFFSWLDLSDQALPGIRAGINSAITAEVAAGEKIVGVIRRDESIPGPDGAPAVRLAIYSPTGPKPAIGGYLHMHGGGFVVGTVDIHDMGNRLTAAALNCVIVSVDYRLAPETRFPGALEDCYVALKWLKANSDRLGIDVGKIAIGGESSGGTLAAALALLARDRGEVAIIHQQLIYPLLDDRQPGAANPFAGAFMWTRKNNEFAWASLLSDNVAGVVSPYAAPARAGDLVGLPPAFISVGALDLLADENLDYARRLAHSGVPVELHMYTRAFHGFDRAHDSHVAKAHRRDQLDALRRAFLDFSG